MEHVDRGRIQLYSHGNSGLLLSLDSILTLEFGLRRSSEAFVFEAQVLAPSSVC